MADATSLPPDPAVLETEIFGSIVSRLVAGIAALASSPARTSASWERVRVSVNLTRADSGRRPSYRVSVDAEPGRGVGPSDDSVAAFVSRIFAGVARTAQVPEQVSDVFLATATKEEGVCRTYDWRGSSFARPADPPRDPRDAASTPDASLPPSNTATLAQEEPSRLRMRRARRDSRPKSHAGLLPAHAFTSARFTWTRHDAGVPAPAPARAVADEVVDAIRRQVECLPEGARVDVAAADGTEAAPSRRDVSFASTRDPSRTLFPAATPERREVPRELATRGAARGAGPARGWSATVSVRFERVDKNVDEPYASTSMNPNGALPNEDEGGSLEPAPNACSNPRRAPRRTPRVFCFENGALLAADAALARGALDWICASSASVWDTCNVPRVFRRAVRERADGDGVVSLAFESEPPGGPSAAAEGGALGFAGARFPAGWPAFEKHAYRVAELIVHLTRDEAFLASEASAEASGVVANGEERERGSEGVFFFHPSALVAENAPPRHRPGEAERARARLARAALDAAVWQAKRLDAVAFASASERAAAAAAATVAEAAVATLRRGERAGAPFAVRAARALGSVVGADWEAEYRDAMLATAFEDAKYS